MTSRTTLEPTGLLGTWSMDRTIDDRLGTEISSVDGTSELVLEDDGRVRWSERGTLHRGDLDIPVSRVLFVEHRAGGWWVTFDDGRDFHPWAPGDEVVHPCAADTYVGRIEAKDADRWTVRWDVMGPAKDYTMTTTLTRHAS
ncbi:MAG: hypothetical protein JWR55_2502 [Aeromicrobium sp.]|nr:hypothetical protein [Aeromicrobium sp.]